MKLNNRITCFGILTLTITLLNGCAGMSGKQAGGLICINCEAENKSTAVILAPAIGKCDDVISRLSVDEAASRIKRKFNFMTTDEMRSSPNGNLLLSSSDYGYQPRLVLTI